MFAFRSVVSVFAVVAGLGTAHAATLVGTQRNALGINDLVVDGKTYDVTFDTRSLDAVYPSTTQSFFSQSMAFDAVTSVASFFNSNGVTGIVDNDTYEFNVPYERNSDGSFSVLETFNGGHQVGGWEFARVGRPGGDTNYGHNAVAVFSVSEVPLPASAPMFGAALLALGAVGYGVRRKKAAAAA